MNYDFINLYLLKPDISNALTRKFQADCPFPAPPRIY